MAYYLWYVFDKGGVFFIHTFFNLAICALIDVVCQEKFAKKNILHNKNIFWFLHVVASLKF